jgi:nickel/cobalt exporter
MSPIRRACARHRGAALVLFTGLCLGAMLVAAPAASAHPLGNATVNHYDGLHLYPDHITDLAVEDVAEIPTLQRKPLIDGNGDGRLSPTELSGYGDRQCAALAAGDRLAVDGKGLRLRVTSAEYTERPGAIGLSAGRLVCRLTAPADLSHAATVSIDDAWDGAGIGWHELTAVGSGVSLRNSPVPATSISDALRRYPNDLLSSPLDQRSADLSVSPGADASTYATARGVSGGGTVARLLNDVTTTFDGLVGRHHLTFGVGLLAVLLSTVLGAGHAFLPGHGKTIMAAYLVGKRGSYRDVATVGATVTLTHTGGVLIIGLLLSVTASLVPTVVVQDLSVVSGLMVAGVGLWLLITAVRRRLPAAVVPDGPAADPALAYAGTTAGHSHGAIPHGDHHHGTTTPHRHDDHAPAPSGFGRKGLVSLGVAGGLVPSPSALLVLLAAIALGRTLFGIVLVIGYGLGMALAFTAAGLLLIRLSGRIGRLTRYRFLTWLLAALPALTACLVLVVGVGLVLRALAGTV